jgi:hypothetical protein
LEFSGFLKDPADVGVDAHGWVDFSGYLSPTSGLDCFPCGEAVPYCSDRFNPELLTL